MKPRTPEVTPQDDLFRSRLENLIAPRHPLVLLAQRIDWEGLNTEFGSFYEDAVVGGPAVGRGTASELHAHRQAHGRASGAMPMPSSTGACIGS